MITPKIKNKIIEMYEKDTKNKYMVSKVFIAIQSALVCSVDDISIETTVYDHDNDIAVYTVIYPDKRYMVYVNGSFNGYNIEVFEKVQK